MPQLTEAAFWLALGKIVWVNILLSGDNAVVIALAARRLPERERLTAIVAGSLAAIVLRVALTVFAVGLLQLAYLKIAGALLLLWIGVQLLVPDTGGGARGVAGTGHLWSAMRTILVADLVMSLDNVIAVAAAADSGPPESRLWLLAIGLGLSIPLIVYGSQFLLRAMQRYPAIVTLGSALLGFVAGEMLLTDRALAELFERIGAAPAVAVELAGAGGVVLVGRWLARRRLGVAGDETARSA